MREKKEIRKTEGYEMRKEGRKKNRSGDGNEIVG
jgi:hypothetical protein